MSWCDKLASQPSVGLQLDPYYGGNETIMTRLAPLVAKWGTPEKPQFSIEVPDIYRVNIQRENGFLYSFDALKAFVQFQHRMKLKPVSGDLPVAELISSSKIYTSLLDEAIELLIESSILLPESGKRHVRRIGIVTTTVVSEEDLPPGIAKFIKYMGSPWKGDLDHYNFNITAKLNDDNNFTDRCIHHLIKPEDTEALLTIKFDWQRILKKPIPLTEHELKRHCSSAKDGALRYFEELAEGDAFDAGA